MVDELWNMVSALHPVMLQSPKYACSMGDRKGKSLSMSLNLWVGWLLQHKIIDGPACQGVLIWDGVCQVGMWVVFPTTTYTKSDTCAF